MHILHDEQGNVIPHGGHECNHTHEKNENLALLMYMLEHNQHHAKELEEVADKLNMEGYSTAAEKIRAGVAEFQKGNAYLSQAAEELKKYAEDAVEHK